MTCPSQCRYSSSRIATLPLLTTCSLRTYATTYVLHATTKTPPTSFVRAAPSTTATSATPMAPAPSAVPLSTSGNYRVKGVCLSPDTTMMAATILLHKTVCTSVLSATALLSVPAVGLSSTGSLIAALLSVQLWTATTMMVPIRLPSRVT